MPEAEIPEPLKAICKNAAARIMEDVDFSTSLRISSNVLGLSKHDVSGVLELDRSDIPSVLGFDIEKGTTPRILGLDIEKPDVGTIELWRKNGSMAANFAALDERAAADFTRRAAAASQAMEKVVPATPPIIRVPQEKIYDVEPVASIMLNHPTDAKLDAIHGTLRKSDRKAFWALLITAAILVVAVVTLWFTLPH